MADYLNSNGYTDLMKIGARYYYLHDIELREQIDEIGVYDSYEPNIFPEFEPNKFYYMDDSTDPPTYIALETKPEDWDESYYQYLFHNTTGLSSLPEVISSSYVIFKAMMQKLDIATFEEFVEHIDEYVIEVIDGKLDKSTFEEFLEGFEEFVTNLSEVAYSGSFNDLSDTPAGLGVHVEGTDLVFSGLAYGGMSAEEDENLAGLIGSGVI